MKQTDQYIVVTVPPQTPEYNTVQQQFSATGQGAFSTVVKVVTTLFHHNKNNPFLHLLGEAKRVRLFLSLPLFRIFKVKLFVG